MHATLLLLEKHGVESVFIATDSASSRDYWTGKLERLGVDTFSSLEREPGIRNAKEPMLNASAEWLVVASSIGIVHSKYSTYGSEAMAFQGIRDAHFELEPFRRIWHPR